MFGKAVSHYKNRFLFLTIEYLCKILFVFILSKPQEKVIFPSSVFRKLPIWKKIAILWLTIALFLRCSKKPVLVGW